MSTTADSINDLLKPHLVTRAGFAFLHLSAKPRVLYASGGPHHPRGPLKKDDDGLRRVALHYVIRGEASYTDWNGNVHRLSPGSLAVVHNDRFSIVPRDPAEYFQYLVLFDSETARNLSDCGMIDAGRPTTAIGLSFAILAGFDDLIRCLQKAPLDVHHTAFARAVGLLALLYEQAHASRKGHLPVYRAIQLIESNLQRPLAVDELAQSVGMSASSFRKVFREETGKSPKELYINFRIRKATELMLEMNVQETADTLGYSDAFQFSKQFKAITGISPKTYIQQIHSGAHE